MTNKDYIEQDDGVEKALVGSTVQGRLKLTVYLSFFNLKTPTVGKTGQFHIRY